MQLIRVFWGWSTFLLFLFLSFLDTLSYQFFLHFYKKYNINKNKIIKTFWFSRGLSMKRFTHLFWNTLQYYGLAKICWNYVNLKIPTWTSWINSCLSKSKIFIWKDLVWPIQPISLRPIFYIYNFYIYPIWIFTF